MGRRSVVGPAVQASYMKNLLATLAAGGRLERLVEIDPELVAEVEAAPRTAWLPIALNVRMVEAMAGAFGAERGLTILAECVYAQFDTPLWRNFVAGGIRLLGRDPGSLGRWIPQALKLVFRDCGAWSAERSSPTELTVTARELPPELAHHELWIRSLAIGFSPLLTLCRTSGASELEALDADAGLATFVVRWKGETP
ncbi:MAG: hypothetical protein HKP30_04675 [Myxococcales bacterium]|nr:hypothetical protein [Myxococcales bacterium]